MSEDLKPTRQLKRPRCPVVNSVPCHWPPDWRSWQALGLRRPQSAPSPKPRSRSKRRMETAMRPSFIRRQELFPACSYGRMPSGYGPQCAKSVGGSHRRAMRCLSPIPVYRAAKRRYSITPPPSTLAIQQTQRSCRR